MNSPVKGTKVILAIANVGYQPVEYGVTKKVLEDHGIIVITAANEPGGAVAKDKSTTIVNVTLDSIDMKEYDGIFLIGGPGALEALDTPTVHKIIAEANRLNKPFGAICISVRILAKTGVLKGKNATGWDADKALRGIIEGFGGIYKDNKPVVTDGKIVTAEGPKAAQEFGQAIVRVVTEEIL